MQKRLLIIEDEQGLRCNIHRYLTGRGYQVAMAPDGESALTMMESAEFDLIIVDLRLPDTDGSSLVNHISNMAPTTLILVISATGNLEVVLGLLRAGVYDYLAKPFEPRELVARINNILKRSRSTAGAPQLLPPKLDG